MPSKDPVQPLQDIVGNINRTGRFLTGKDPLDIAEDERTLFASQYALLIISEAVKRLGDDAEVLWPGRSRRDIRGTGNHPRQAYDNLDAVLIWKVFHEHLPALKAAVSAALERLIAAILLNVNFLERHLPAGPTLIGLPSEFPSSNSQCCEMPQRSRRKGSMCGHERFGICVEAYAKTSQLCNVNRGDSDQSG